MSNAIWVLLAFAAAQFVKRAFAKSATVEPDADASNPLTSRESQSAETPVDAFRRVLRSTFAFLGLLIVLLLICDAISRATDLWQHVAGWTAVALVWLAWLWALRDRRLAGRVFRGNKPKWMRMTLAGFVIVFWLMILSGLILVVYSGS